jgi:hypothetical protein
MKINLSAKEYTEISSFDSSTKLTQKTFNSNRCYVKF